MRIQDMRLFRYEAARAYAEKKAAEASAYETAPFRMLRNPDSGTQIVTAIGEALTGAPDELDANGESRLVTTIEAIIQRDIDAQKDDLAAKRSVAQGAGGMLRELLEQLGDERAAELTLKDMVCAVVQRKVRELIEK